ncbi:hypothetical protein AB0165_29690, partial [Klebsiella variicola]|uniref:hypothetical protein n=1 Tax=Klebsiella variicola TaxID=244366 RepID=UPI0034500761
SPLPQLALRATGDSNACSPFPGGKPCAAVAADAPLVSYALGLPGRLVVHVVRGADARDIGFDGVALTVPVFMSIPTNIGNTLEIAVNVLREAF